MLGRCIAAAVILASLAAAPLDAQTGTPSSGGRPATTVPNAPPASAPAATAQSRAAVPASQKVNLNTATADELHTLPDVGDARAKAILNERGKGRFKNWADFDKRMAGTSVNAGVKNKIKDLVAF